MQNKNNKPGQRSVAIQSIDLSDSNAETRPVTARLCKKTGFRNLLQKSLTVASRQNERGSETDYFSGGKTSRSVQATLDGDPGRETIFEKSFGGNRSLEFNTTTTNSRGSITEMMVVDGGRGGVGRRTGSSGNPGTSRMTPTEFSSLSVISQMNEVYRRPQEGSLALVYNYGDKTLPNSRSSNLFYYGSQGSRRFSDETVLLIEDYQSYDYTNAAGRQETDGSGQEKKIGKTCCGEKRKRRSTDPSSRPIPIEEIEELDDSMVCRICHEGENVEPLLQPCLCKGSVGCIHACCLKVWLEQSNTSRCELCNYPYAIRQHKKYSKGFSVRVFFGKIIDRRTLIYDAISFVVITPLTLVGVAMCIQASLFSSKDLDNGSNFQMGNITKAGMIMLSGTIVVAYGVWLYTLASFHYKAWKKWYSNCYDVEVLPVRMTSEEKIEAAQKLNEETSRRQMSREHGSTVVTLLHSPQFSFYQRRLSVSDGPR